MRKLVVLALVMFSLSTLAYSQVNPRAIGLRLGGGIFVEGEVSYQHGLSEVNRIELDLGFGSSEYHSKLYAVGIYHWDWNITESLNWYIGPGAGVGIYTTDDSYGYINIGIGGQIGLEYDFNSLDIPLLASIDARPMWDLFGNHAGLGWGAALGVRYTF